MVSLEGRSDRFRHPQEVSGNSTVQIQRNSLRNWSLSTSHGFCTRLQKRNASLWSGSIQGALVPRSHGRDYSFGNKWQLCSGTRKGYFWWIGSLPIRPSTANGTAIHCNNSADAFNNAVMENGAVVFFSNKTMHDHMPVTRPLPPFVN